MNILIQYLDGKYAVIHLLADKAEKMRENIGKSSTYNIGKGEFRPIQVGIELPDYLVSKY